MRQKVPLLCIDQKFVWHCLNKSESASANLASFSFVQLAQKVIGAVSPVTRIVVERKGRRAGYALKHEHDYWAGYSRIRHDELSDQSLSDLPLSRFSEDTKYGFSRFRRLLDLTANFRECV